MRLTAILLGVIATAALPVSQASATESELAELRAQIAALTARVQELEADPRPVGGVAGAEPSVRTENVVKVKEEERIKIKGDMRYRHEWIDQTGSSSRTRQRIRARAGLTAKVSDDVEVGFQLASGGEDPVSANQTLGDGASSKDVFIDLAYFDWNIGTAGAHLRGGKFKNTLTRVGGTQLLWDGDWNPEGLSAYFDTGSFFGNAAALWVEERSGSSDSIVAALQAGARVDVGDSKLTFGAGYYDIGVTEGEEPFFDGNPRGNTVDAMGNYVFDYEELEVFAELKGNVGDLPLTVFADWVKNLDADDFDTGWAVGAKLGKAKKPGTWQLGYEYRDVEADAVLALFADSDFGGGGTDAKGHILTGAYQTGKRWNVKATWFINDRNENAGNELDFDRVQLDANFKY